MVRLHKCMGMLFTVVVVMAMLLAACGSGGAAGPNAAAPTRPSTTNLSNAGSRRCRFSGRLPASSQQSAVGSGQ